jgi:asparagine synthase (glutamine-hydrolysing)
MVRERHAISYNGEIYNYKEIRDSSRLHASHLRSSGDTEVLLEGLRRRGTDLLNDLDGMFAFALWDGEEALLALDRFGEKQMYAAQMPEGVYVSSELGPLVDLLLLSPSMSPDALCAFLTLGYIPAPETIYPQVSKLPPATYVTVSGGNLGRFQSYWQPQAGVPGRGAPEPLSKIAIDRIHEALAVGLSRRLIADRPLCLLLSGGVDSALIAALASQDASVELECLTIQFDDPAAPQEAEAAARTASHLGLAHYKIQGMPPSEATAAFALDLFGQPNDNLGAIAVHQVTDAAARRGYPVGLIGMGADEVFFGYKKQQFAWRNRNLYAVPEFIRSVVNRSVQPFSRFDRRIDIYRNLFGVPDSQLYLALKNQPTIHALQHILGIKAWAEREFSGMGPIELGVPMFERNHVLPNSQLAAADVGSMRSSVELRTPYLSRQLADVVAEYDPRAFLAFGPKSVARRILGRFIPLSLVDGIKKGFVSSSAYLDNTKRPRLTFNSDLQSLAANAWPRRREAGWQRIATRLVMLDAAMGEKLEP